MDSKIYSKQVKLNLDDVLKNVEKPKQYTIPIFIPHLGCKHKCVFCNQRKISGNISCPSVDDVKNTIEKYLKYFNCSKSKIQIAFFGGSFTGIKMSEQESYLKIAYEYVKQKKVDSIRLSTRPDYISNQILDMLKNYGVKSIELGVQTMCPDVLIASKRGHTVEDVIKAALLISSYGFELGFQIMIGLPESTLEKEVYTINQLLKYNPKNLRIYPVYVINPSELYDMYTKGKYIPLTIDESINRTYAVLKQCLKSDVKVIRIGLQCTDEITQKNKEIIGPVCDNFAEYVLARLALDKIEPIILKIKEENESKEESKKEESKKEESKKINQVIFVIDDKTPESIIIGPKQINKKYIFKKYQIEIKTKKIEKLKI